MHQSVPLPGRGQFLSVLALAKAFFPPGALPGSGDAPIQTGATMFQTSSHPRRTRSMKISKLKARAESLGLLLEPVLLGGFWLIDREGMESRFGKAHEIEKHLVYFAENGRFPEQNGR